MRGMPTRPSGASGFFFFLPFLFFFWVASWFPWRLRLWSVLIVALEAAWSSLWGFAVYSVHILAVNGNPFGALSGFPCARGLLCEQVGRGKARGGA